MTRDGISNSKNESTYENGSTGSIQMYPDHRDGDDSAQSNELTNEKNSCHHSSKIISSDKNPSPNVREISIPLFKDTAYIESPDLSDIDPNIIKVSVLKHLKRTIIVAIISFCLIFFNTNIQIWVDNEALRYFYDVTTEQQWKDFNNSMYIIKNNKVYADLFPNVLVQKKFGGFGQNGLLPSLESIQNTNSSRGPYTQALLIDDVIFRSPNLGYLRTQKIADVLAQLIILLTVVFILVLPYFYMIKTMIKRRMCARKGSLSSITILPRPANEASKKSSLLLFPARFIHGLVFVRRGFILMGIVFFTRGLTLGLDILPQESYECIPVLRSTLWSHVSGALFMTIGIHPACHDFVFSGHTAVTTLLAWFWIAYNTHALFHPGRYVLEDTRNENKMKHRFFTYRKAKRSIISSSIVWIMRIIAVVYIFAVGFCLITSRIHYTMDVVIAIVYATTVFWLWHALLTLFYMFRFRGHVVSLSKRQKLEYNSDVEANHSSSYHIVVPEHDIKYRERLKTNIELRDILVPITRFTWILKFVGWCDGYDLYTYDGIGFDERGRGVPGSPTTCDFEPEQDASETMRKPHASDTHTISSNITTILSPLDSSNV